ncbi:MAG: hypothetical protein CMJ48_13835 [Planctomycetaceae bacterium]|nr:hypothetical protein [Planctomycetaceae bacterium]
MTTPDQQSASQSLAKTITDRIEALLLESEQETKPLEIDPYRARLFELFVTAEGTGYIDDEAEPDLTADGIARELGQRWNLADAAQQSTSNQTRIPDEHFSKMRLMWSFMRMWMEWTYAWGRWEEFHRQAEPRHR